MKSRDPERRCCLAAGTDLELLWGVLGGAGGCEKPDVWEQRWRRPRKPNGRQRRRAQGARDAMMDKQTDTDRLPSSEGGAVAPGTRISTGLECAVIPAQGSGRNWGGRGLAWGLGVGTWPGARARSPAFPLSGYMSLTHS